MISKCYIGIVALLTICLTSELVLGREHLTNMDSRCLDCLCHAATGCNTTRGCGAGYCGPYQIYLPYWIDAGNTTLPGQTPDTPGAFENCSNDFWCARRMVLAYMNKYGADCNLDEVTDCDDYLMIHFNGGNGCYSLMDRSETSRLWLHRYGECMRKHP